jgi:hypothetical protein
MRVESTTRDGNAARPNRMPDRRRAWSRPAPRRGLAATTSNRTVRAATGPKEAAFPYGRRISTSHTGVRPLLQHTRGTP